MTERAEIERLLQKTGRTLEGLPARYSYRERNDALSSIELSIDAVVDKICHQSDVIELLVGALRDALDKPMQKPLTLEEANRAPWVYFEERPNGSIEYDIYPSIVNYRIGYSFVDIEHMYRGDVEYKANDYGVIWRCWASKPTDEERETAEWERRLTAERRNRLKSD